MTGPTSTGSALAAHLVGLERGRFEYACFLHPRSVGQSLEELCHECNLPYGFPLIDEFLPESINDHDVVGQLGRGFYGSVYKTSHQRLPGRLFATKVIPVTTYADETEGGYGRSIEDEVELLRTLERCGIAPVVTDIGRTTLQFGGHDLECYFIEMEFIEGETLSKVLAGSKAPSTKEITQIAYDLLEIVAQLQQRGQAHNDLHASNVIISRLPEREARSGRVIHPLINVKVLDLGAGGSGSKKDDRLTDVQWVAGHILALIDAFETKSVGIQPPERRTCAHLRSVSEHFLGKPDVTHPPNPRDIQDAIAEAWTTGRKPNMQVRLTSVSSHPNARTMPGWFTPELLYDPDGSWGKTLSGPETHLVYGMRGCGKTMLLRSLEWTARLHPRQTERGKAETAEEVRARVKDEEFLGLFLSCSALLRGLRPEVVETPVQRTFMAFAREVLQNAELCEINGVGKINHWALKNFATMISTHIPWIAVPEGFVTPGTIEGLLNQAMRERPTDGLDDFTAHAAFEELAVTTRDLVDIWANKRILFMLDDLSRRILQKATVDALLDQLALFSPNFAFKVSTESQTVVPRTTGGQRGQLGREYSLFNLGKDVYDKLGGLQGVRFIEQILNRRLQVLNDPNTRSPSVVLGVGRHLKDLARELKDGKDDAYHGLEALAAMCVGDISDVLLLYQRIESKAEGKSLPLRPKEQHEIAIDFAGSKLRTINHSSGWLHRHALAFARASNRELHKSSPTRLRMFGLVHIEIPASGGAAIYPKLMQLVEEGIYVLAGSNERAKDPRAQHVLQIKLAFRNILGLPTRIPLSRRDRFEFNSLEDLQDWLEDPEADKLTFGKLVHVEDDLETARSPLRDEKPGYQESLPGLEGKSDRIRLPRLHNNFSVNTIASGGLIDLPILWPSAVVIGALGFEERGLESWVRVVDAGASRVIALRYPAIGRSPEVIDLLQKAQVDVRMVNLDSGPKLPDQLITIVRSIPDNVPLIVDITSISKVYIYQLLRELLVNRNEVHIIYTEAESYWPPDGVLSDLAADVGLLAPPALRDLDARLGDVQFETVILDDSRDPTSPTLLVAPIPLKHSRVLNIVDNVNVDSIAAIVPLANNELRSLRTTICDSLADFYVDLCGGDKYPVGALDYEGVYRLLENLHSEYALTYGYNFELALTGDKMHTVAAAMIASVTTVSAVYFSNPIGGHIPSRFTQGSGRTFAFSLQRVHDVGDG